MSQAKSLHSFTSHARGRDNGGKTKSTFSGVSRSGAFCFDGAEGSGLYVHSLFPKSHSLFAFQGVDSRVDAILNETRRFARRRALLSDSENCKRFLRDREPLSAGTLGFRVRRYRSGETTGAQFLTGREYHSTPPSRTGAVETTTFTQQARQKIRRAVENSDTQLKYFWTLTFAPSLLHPWQKNDDDTVRHDYAKYKLKKFLHTLSVKITRLNQARVRDCLNKGIEPPDLAGLGYVWVAEIQEENTNNIHFHILLDRFFRVEYIRKIWDQEINSVHVKFLDDACHGANYMRKYMQKQDATPIKGNRYNISSHLRAKMQPEELLLASIRKADIEEGVNPVKDVQDILKSIRGDIEARGGRVLDFGFHIPKPRRKKRYKLQKDSETWSLQGKKKGDMVETNGVSSELAPQVLDIIGSEESDKPF